MYIYTLSVYAKCCVGSIQNASMFIVTLVLKYMCCHACVYNHWLFSLVRRICFTRLWGFFQTIPFWRHVLCFLSVIHILLYSLVFFILVWYISFYTIGEFPVLVSFVNRRSGPLSVALLLVHYYYYHHHHHHHHHHRYIIHQDQRQLRGIARGYGLDDWGTIRGRGWEFLSSPPCPYRL